MGGGMMGAGASQMGGAGGMGNYMSFIPGGFAGRKRRSAGNLPGISQSFNSPQYPVYPQMQFPSQNQLMSMYLNQMLASKSAMNMNGMFPVNPVASALPGQAGAAAAVAGAPPGIGPAEIAYFLNSMKKPSQKTA